MMGLWVLHTCFLSIFTQVVPAGSAPSQESGGSSPAESGGESGSEGKTYRSKEQLMLRANSLKKALRQIIEQAEKGNSAARLPPLLLQSKRFEQFTDRALLFQWLMSKTDTRRSRGCHLHPPSRERTVRS